MRVIPAIDLKGGKCVRLLRGDLHAETVYGDDPVAMGRRWVAAGARYLHVVDLDGAVSGAPVNGDAIAALFFVHVLRSGSAATALAGAAASIYGLLRRTAEAGSREILTVAAQDEFVAPTWTFPVEAL